MPSTVHNAARSALVVLVLLLAGCSAAPSGEAPEPATEPAAASADDAVEKDLTAALMAAEFAWQDGRTSAAARHFLRAATLSSDAKIAEHATRVALVSKQFDLATQAVERWRALDPEALGLRQAEAVLSLQAGRDGDADAILLKLLTEHDEDGRKLAAQALAVAAQPDKAVPALERLAKRSQLDGDADALLVLAQTSQQLKQDQLALRFADRAVAAAPEDARTSFWRGHLRLRAGDKENAAKDFAEAVRLAPEERDYRLTQAALLGDEGESQRAARLLLDAQHDDETLAAAAAYAARANDQPLMREAYVALEALPEPRPDGRLELLGQMAELLERDADALRWYREVPRGERWLSAQLRIPVLLDDAGKEKEAFEHIDGLRAGGIQEDDKLADSFLLEGELHARHGRREDAIAAHTRGLQALPDERRLLYARALTYEQLGREDEAERDLRRIVALDPKDADALNALGYTLADHGRHLEEAQSLIEQALALKPDEAAILDSLGWVQFRRGQLDAAVGNLRRAYELQADAEIAAHLGEVLWQQGKREEARAAWQKGLAKEKDNETLLETMRRLDQ
jgi:tetratricopeptide (TPR) repeat protein